MSTKSKYTIVPVEEDSDLLATSKPQNTERGPADKVTFKLINDTKRLSHSTSDMPALEEEEDDNDVFLPAVTKGTAKPNMERSLSDEYLPEDYLTVPALGGRPDANLTVTSTCSGTGEYLRELHKQGKIQRLVKKGGACNITMSGISKKKMRYMRDIFTTFVDMKWRFNIFFFFMGFIGTWMIYAILYWFVCLYHGDHLHVDDEDWQKCMTNVYDFTTAFLFSLETQHTIGYGFRAMEPKCPEAIILLILQSSSGVFIQSLMTGIIFAKLARGKKRAKTIMFSYNAVICKRDDIFCLLFRVGDIRPKSHVICANVRAILVRSHITEEGEKIPLNQYPLEVETEASLGDSYTFLVWPATIVHKITSKSPLWDLSAEQLKSDPFEVVVILEGTVGSSGATAQMRTSYLPNEILWGHHLAPLVTFQRQNGQYKIDYSRFHATEPIDMPKFSAKDFDAKMKASHFKNRSREDLSRFNLFVNRSSKKESSLGSLRERLLWPRKKGDTGSLPNGAPSARAKLGRRSSVPNLSF